MREDVVLKAQTHLEALVRRHRDLDAEVAQLSARPGIPASEIAFLKRRKLVLADRISRLRRGV